MMRIIAKNTQRRFAEREMLSDNHWQLYPSHGKSRPKLTMRKQRDVPV